MMGDRWSDIEAGRRAGCETVFLNNEYLEQSPANPDFVAATISVGIDYILTRAAEKPSVKSLTDLRVKLFADGANLSEMLRLYANPMIAGFTTNPTLMRKAGVSDYKGFAVEVLRAISDRPISFEVFSDEFEEMKREALLIADWGENVYVKIPITNTRGEGSLPLIQGLSHDGIKVNVTAVLTMKQIREASRALEGGAPSCISVFAGRIADTGRDPVPIMAAAVEVLKGVPSQELIWASPREVLNVYQADQVGCHIITATPEILSKLNLVGKDLSEFSADTVKMFREDALKAAFKI